MPKIQRHILILLSFGLISACSSTGELPEEYAALAGDSNKYPKASQAPAAPTDIRSDKSWDKDAKAIMSARSTFKAPPEANDEYKSEAEILRELESLRAKVKEYKLDDPVE